MKTRYFIVFSLLISTTICLSQEYTPQHIVPFTVSEGLTSGNVQKITQDRQGFIWIATEYGLHRYDGYQFTAYKQNQNSEYHVNHSFITAVTPRNNYGVWVGTISGLNKYDAEKGSFTHYYFYENSRKLFKPVSDIIPLSNGSCFLRTDEPLLYLFSHIHDSIQEISYTGFIPSSLPKIIVAKDSVSVLVGDRNGCIYTLTHTGSSELLDSLEFSITSLLYVDSASFLAADANGTIHLYTNNVRVHSFPFPISNTTISERNISSILHLQDSVFYIGTRGAGLFKFSHNSGWDSNQALPALHNKNINHLFKDAHKNIWIAHAYGGISMIPNQKHSVSYPLLPAIIQQELITALEKIHNELWIATENNGLFIYSLTDNSIEHYNAQTGILGVPFDNQITSLSTDGRVMWISSFNMGVFAIDITNRKQVFRKELEQIPAKEIAIVYAARSGLVWLGTYDKGCFVFNTNTASFEQHFHTSAGSSHRISTNGITAILEDSQENVWIGGYYGLSKIPKQGGAITRFTPNNTPKLQNNVITDLFEDAHKTIWIGTLEGINTYSLETNTLEIFNIPYFDVSFSIKSLFMLDSSTIACITPRDIYVYNTSNHSLGYIGSSPFGEFSQQAYVLTQASHFFTGTQKGVVSVYIDTATTPHYSGRIELTDLSVNGKSVFSSKSPYSTQFLDGLYSIKLPYYENNISIQFSDLIFDKQTRSTFVYKLEGLQDEWQTLSNHNLVHYTNLSGGSYTFRVRKQTIHGLSDYELVVHVHIQKAFWEMWLFYLALGALLILIIYFIYTARVNKILTMRNKLQRQVELRIRDIKKQNEEIQHQKNMILEQRDTAHKQSAEFAREREVLIKAQEDLINQIAQRNSEIESSKHQLDTLQTQYDTMSMQFNAISHFSREMIFRIQLPEEDFMYVSSASTSLTGYTPDEFYADKNLFKKLIFPDDADKFKKFRKYLVQGKVPPLMEYRILTREGLEKWVAQHSHLIRDNENNPIAYEAMLVDINHIKDAEQKAAAAMQRAKDLEELHQNSSNTEEGTLQVFAELLNKPGISLDEKQAFIEEHNQDTTSLQMIDDIIDIYKIESGELHLNNSQCYVNAILQELHKSFTALKNKNKKKHITLDLELPIEEDNFSFYTDTFRFRQIMMNLLGNAIKFTSQGWIRFGYNIIETIGPETDKEIVFFVQDSGSGIASEHIPYIFERFKSSDGKFGFSGVGLYLSYKLAELLGGKMRVESVVGVGSIFQFSLPLEKMKGLKKSEIEITEENELHTIDWSQKTLLLAEDEENNYEYVKEALKKTNISIIWVTNGEDAITSYTNNARDIDIILMDIQMPKLDGYEATRKIKAFDKDIPIVAQTAYANYEAKLFCFDAGCDSYIAKPYKAKDLIEILAKYLPV